LKKSTTLNRVEKNDILTQVHQFYDEANPINRAVTSLEWSTKVKDLILTSYSHAEEVSPYEKDGLVLLWSLNLRKRPEYVLECQSEVTSAIIHPFQSNLVVGGTYSGYLVVWDLKVGPTPVQKTPLSSQAHSHPIYCLSVVGTSNANHIVSVSNNGRMCIWSLGMLKNPEKTIDFKCSKEVAPQCVTFPEEETNSYLIGADDGGIYSGLLHSGYYNY
jgi:dynein intermediate chain